MKSFLHYIMRISFIILMIGLVMLALNIPLSIGSIMEETFPLIMLLAGLISVPLYSLLRNFLKTKKKSQP